MKNPLIFSFLFVMFFMYAQEKTVVVSPAKLHEVYDTLYYGARLEPLSTIGYSAPVSGIVTKIYVKPGTVVDKNTALFTVTRKSAASDYLPYTVYAYAKGTVAQISIVINQEITERTIAITIADLSHYKTELLLSDKDVQRVKTGDNVYIRNTNLMGKVNWISLIPEESGGLFKAEVVFQPHPTLYAGAFKDIEIRVDYFKGIVIPIEWINRKYGQTLVYLVKDNIIEYREIVTGKRYGDKTSVIKGLKEEEQIVIRSNKTLFDADEVRVNTESNADQRRGGGAGTGAGRGR